MNRHRKEIAELIETTFRAAEARLREEHERDLCESLSRAQHTQNAAAILPAQADSYIRHIKTLTTARAQTIAEAYTTVGEPSGEAAEEDLANYYKTVLSARKSAFQGQAELSARRTGLSLHQLPGLLRRIETDTQSSLLEGRSILAKQRAAFRNASFASGQNTGNPAIGPRLITANRASGPTKEQFDDLLPLLFRRKVFDTDLSELTSLAMTNARPLSLLMIDIDHFKKVNDAHGHPVGDQVLVQTSELLQSRVESKGKGYRYGGEELAVLLENYTPEEATVLAEIFRADVETATCPKGLRITVSIGVASFSSHATDSAGLLKAADDALLQAKRLGRNLVRVSGEPESGPAEIRSPLRRHPPPSVENEILREAANAGGQILWITTDQNPSFISVGKRTFPSTDKLNLYESKKARQNLELLKNRGLIELLSRDAHGGEIYELTVNGFAAAGVDRSTS